MVLLVAAGVLAWLALTPGAPGSGGETGPVALPASGDTGTAPGPGAEEPAAAPAGGPPAGDGGTEPTGRGGGRTGPGDPGPGGGTVALRVEEVASGLQVPWDMAFDPQGRLFFTERPGRINLLDGGRVIPLTTLPDTVAIGESGLLGIALHPGFPDPPYVYVYQTYQARGRGAVVNRVLRFRFDPGTEAAAGGGTGPRLTDRRVIFDGIPASAIHDGGQLEFGPDGKLYLTTGDARAAEQAQNPRSLHGKILRLNPDGTVPRDNPLGPDNPVYSYGHRNPEGLAFDPATGRLFAVEHGPDAWDEVNRIEPGANYGWPEAVAPDSHGGRFTPPLRSYDPIIAPAGAAFYRGPVRAWDGSLFFGTLGFQPDSPGRHLHRVRLDPSGTRVVEEEVLFKGQYGRIRAVQVGPDGCIYFGTSNRDGRGEPVPGDDRILRACPVG
ncbi:PQQ-dependent sugar dehydrogenase [Thermaerobacter marianensis]|uniref:PQQ-dependent sugar dehydrogenase n=1 Tax=Thermaerobacter marianensis TaxID=73919 RepID=UPI0002FB34AF|nr:PQQ-dependent sugar dehydrogenase [Thermaerobacter marianensis]